MRYFSIAAALVTGLALASPASASPQTDKMKACNSQWAAYKAIHKVSGRDAYQAYLRPCLKGPAPTLTPAAEAASATPQKEPSPQTRRRRLTLPPADAGAK
jgi:hypothetical protein